MTSSDWNDIRRKPPKRNKPVFLKVRDFLGSYELKSICVLSRTGECFYNIEGDRPVQILPKVTHWKYAPPWEELFPDRKFR